MKHLWKREYPMPDLNGWPLACLILMVAIIIVNHLAEKGDR